MEDVKGQRLIGSHNSGTGEKPHALWDKLLVPFCRCQRKTIREQYAAGVRAFDLRVRHDGDWRWWLAHGLWRSETTLWDALCTLNNLADGVVWVNITYEGRLDCEHDENYFYYIMGRCVKNFAHIQLMEVAVKLPTWKVLFRDKEAPRMVQDFDVLDGKNWRRFIPIPWLWWAIRKITDTHAHANKDKVGTWLDFV